MIMNHRKCNSLYFKSPAFDYFQADKKAIQLEIQQWDGKMRFY